MASGTTVVFDAGSRGKKESLSGGVVRGKIAVRCG
jgi:hypothetical protein